MKKTIFAALVATSALAGFAGTASAGTVLLYGTDANDHKTVQIVDGSAAPVAEDTSVAIGSSYQGNGAQLLIVPDDRTDGAKRLFY